MARIVHTDKDIKKTEINAKAIQSSCLFLIGVNYLKLRIHAVLAALIPICAHLRHLRATLALLFFASFAGGGGLEGLFETDVDDGAGQDEEAEDHEGDDAVELGEAAEVGEEDLEHDDEEQRQAGVAQGLGLFHDAAEDERPGEQPPEDRDAASPRLRQLPGEQRVHLECQIQEQKRQREHSEQERPAVRLSPCHHEGEEERCHRRTEVEQPHQGILDRVWVVIDDPGGEKPSKVEQVKNIDIGCAGTE